VLDGRKGQALLIERGPGGKAGKFRLGQVEVVYDLPPRRSRPERQDDLFVSFHR